MRRIPIIALAIVVFAATMAYIDIRLNWNKQASLLKQVEHVQRARSEIYAHMLLRYDKPPVYEEEYSMQDVEGVSKFEYRIRSYDGKQVTLTAPPAKIYDVSFFYGKLDQDGVWQIVNQPDRGNTTA